MVSARWLSSRPTRPSTSAMGTLDALEASAGSKREFIVWAMVAHTLKELDRTARRQCPRGNRSWRRDQTGRSLVLQARFGIDEGLARAAGNRPELDAASPCAAQAPANDADALKAQKTFGKIGIHGAYVGQSFHGTGAAKELCLESLPLCAALQKAIQQKLHQMHGLALSFLPIGAAIGTGEEKVIHAANLRGGIADAGGNAGAKDRREHHIGVVGDEKLTLDNVEPMFADVVGRLISAALHAGWPPLPGHFNFPMTASIWVFSTGTVKGFARKLLTPHAAARSMSVLSPFPVSMMNGIFLVGS